MLVCAAKKTAQATKKKTTQKPERPRTTLSAPDAVPETVSEAAVLEQVVQTPLRKSARGKKGKVRNGV